MRNCLLLRPGIFLLVSLTTISCSSSDRSDDDSSGHEIKTIVVPNVKPVKADFESFIERVEIIPLETRPESLFRNVYDLTCENGKIYIYDRSMQELFVFSESGKFLFKLDKKGKGPGEYVDMRDFKVNSQGDLYILAYRKILVYDSLLRLKETVSLSSLMDKGSISPMSLALAFDSGYYLYVGAFGIREMTPDRYSIYKVDTSGNFHGDVFFPRAK